MNKWLVGIGLTITVLYVAVGVWLLGEELAAIHGLKLNELGDFLAGVFGPLALLWLILGFFQQGIELRQTQSALHLQAEELKASAQQQRELVSVTRQQFEDDRLAREREFQRIRPTIRPTFRIEPRVPMKNIGEPWDPNMVPAEKVSGTVYLQIKNFGVEATDVGVVLSGAESCTLGDQIAVFPSRQVFSLDVVLGEDFFSQFTLTLNYVDKTGVECFDSFLFVVDGEGTDLSVVVIPK